MSNPIKTVTTPEAPLRDVPAGGLNSSATDLSRFLKMVFAGGQSGGHRILKPETLAEMLRPQNTDVALDRDFQMGLG
jgi:CubicO group peptidase (beta-lactamase class C family)